MVFNVLAHNRDDHTKNHSFVMGWDGNWSLSPAYDITFSEGPGGEHNMSVGGEGRTPGRKHLLAVADNSGIPRGDALSVLDQVSFAVARWTEWADIAGLSRYRTAEVKAVLSSPLVKRPLKSTRPITP